MAINDIMQTIAEARVDARSLSEFVFKPAGFKVTRRLAPVVDTLQFYIDRFDATKATSDAYVAAIPTIVNNAINNAVISSGFVTIDSFELGATITQRNQALRHAADGKLYRWAGDLPKVVSTNSTPTSSGGMGDNAWLEVSDATLRQDLANPAMGAAMVKGASIFVGSVEELKGLAAVVGHKVSTLGYYSSGDGGGNEYEIVAGGTGTADGGSFIDLDNGLQAKGIFDGAIDVRKFGARGDGVADDTAAIQQCFNECDSILIKDGTFMCNATTVLPSGPGGHIRGIFIPSNKTIEWVNAKTKAIPTSSPNYTIFSSCLGENITLINPEIEGERLEHTGTSGEWGFGVYMRGVKNVKISGGNITNCWGDGILFGEYVGEGPSRKVIMDNVTVDNNRRNGLTLASIDGFVARNCSFTNTNGTSPQSGVDIEPDGDFQTLKNIFFDNCVFNGNAASGILIYTGVYNKLDGSSHISIALRNCKAKNNTAGYTITRWQNTGYGNITLDNCEAEDNSSQAYRISYWNSDGPKIVLKNCYSIDPPSYYFDLFNADEGYKLGNISIIDMSNIDTGKYSRTAEDSIIFAAGGIDKVLINSIYGQPSVNAVPSIIKSLMGFCQEGNSILTRATNFTYSGIPDFPGASQGLSFYTAGGEVQPAVGVSFDTGIRIHSKSAKLVTVSAKRVGSNYGVFGVYQIARDMNGTGVTSVNVITETMGYGSVSSVSFSVSASGTIILKFGEVNNKLYHPKVTVLA